MEGWLARAGDLASKIFENDGKSSQNLQKFFYFFISVKISRKSSRLLLGPAPAGSGQLRPARPSSFSSKNPRPSEDLKKLIPGHWPKSKKFIVGMDALEVADCGYFFYLLPFSIFLNRMKVLSAAVARTPLAGPFVGNWRNVRIRAGIDLGHEANSGFSLKSRKSNKLQ